MNLSSTPLLGQNTTAHRYDLPLEEDTGVNFLIILIGLMSFLAVMALSGVFITNHITRDWSSGLAGKITLEIPAEGADGTLRSAGDLKTITKNIETTLPKMAAIDTVDILDQSEVEGLIEPWLGDVSNIAALPLPGLVAVTLNTQTPNALNIIKNQLHIIDPAIKIDTHEDWLNDILKLASTLKWATIIITLIITAVTIISIVSAMQARMDIHNDDIELLHLMGARDEYIAQQFQRHARIVSFKGAIAGTGGALVLLLILHLITQNGENLALPELSLHVKEIIGLLLLPLPICFLASWAVRFTTLRALGSMP